jgi:transcription antitermination factor NusG
MLLEPVKVCDLEGEAVAASSFLLAADPAVIGVTPTDSWYALYTRPRHERVVLQRLLDLRIETFFPTVTEVHQWSDRKKTVQLPLFSCYVFARFAPDRAQRLRVLTIDGVLGLVGNRGEGSPIPDDQIDAVHALVERKLPYFPYPFLKVGERVRIRSGALDGVEGILVARNGTQTLVISIDALQRSLAVRVEGYEVEAA